MVRTPSEYGSVHEGGAVSADTGTLEFALPMRAGHRYTIVAEENVAAGTVTVLGRERDAGGAVTRTFGPAATPVELDACQAGEASASAKGHVVPARVSRQEGGYAEPPVFNQDPPPPPPP